MERLTKRVGKYVEIIGCKSLYSSEERKKAPASSAIARLAKYEDTGLTPDEIKTLIAKQEALYKKANDTLIRYKCVECEECIHSGLKEDEKPCVDCINTEGYCGWQWKGIGD